MLEPCDAKVSSTVLRGPGDRKVAWLLDKCRVKPLACLKHTLLDSIAKTRDEALFQLWPLARRGSAALTRSCAPSKPLEWL
jgi:hypothetical protein